jgi:hypothetical protein
MATYKCYAVTYFFIISAVSFGYDNDRMCHKNRQICNKNRQLNETIDEQSNLIHLQKQFIEDKKLTEQLKQYILDKEPKSFKNNQYTLW